MKIENKRKCLYEDCGQNALKTNDWCETHQYCADVLNRLRNINYARLEINSALLAGGTYDDWIAYIVVLPAPGVKFGNARTDRYTQLMKAIDQCAASRIDKIGANMGGKVVAEENTEEWIVSL